VQNVDSQLPPIEKKYKASTLAQSLGSPLKKPKADTDEGLN